MNATIRPWRLSGEAGYISSPRGYVPLVTPFSESANRDKRGGANPEALANAKLIIRAVNGFDALLAACKSVLDWAETNIEEQKHRHAAMIEIVRAAVDECDEDWLDPPGTF